VVGVGRSAKNSYSNGTTVKKSNQIESVDASASAVPERVTVARAEIAEDMGEAMLALTVDAEMLGRAKEHSLAFPAVNCVGSESINAAIKGFADAGSDGIIQFSTGGAEFGSGLGVKDMVTGAVALAEFAHVIAAKYPITVALHTDHCPKDRLDTYVRPLLAISAQRVADGRDPLFQSHMWDGSAVPIDENLSIAQVTTAVGDTRNLFLDSKIQDFMAAQTTSSNASPDIFHEFPTRDTRRCCARRPTPASGRRRSLRLPRPVDSPFLRSHPIGASARADRLTQRPVPRSGHRVGSTPGHGSQPRPPSPS
jgi:hypothetical protein